ncbi:MAG: hypothetical protein NWQ31_00440 [Polaribacter sp.]|nr:hypothetical protein [Polaribacter sp.]
MKIAKNISVQRILQQLKADLIGKDSYRGVTLTYAWLANQFGHISLGFIPTFLVYYFLNIEAFKAALYVATFWFLFELYNFLGPLLSKKESNSDVVFMPKKSKYIFEPKWFNVAFDTFTDVCFFSAGSFLFAFCIYKFNNKMIIIVLAILAIYLLFATRYWYITKMYQFYARFPFQFRLSQWDFSINPSDKLKVENFLAVKNSGNHLLIFGSLSAGKTSLGVGMLNELSIKNNSCLYVSAIKMFSYFFKDEDAMLEAYEIWNWKTANFLMIDDINPSEPIQNALISPTKLVSFIDTLKPENKYNRALLKNKNIIWVLGSKQFLAEKNKDEWKEMLLNIGVEEQKISVINL